MKTREISNRNDVIDSRDVTARIEELESEMTDAMGEWQSESELTKPQALIDWEAEGFMDELEALRKLRDEADGSPDWEYGETLIRDSYFRDYAEQLADDIGAIDRNAQWPICHIDWEAAADALKQDYMSVDFDGVEYWIRA
jgi:hypothetical protein